MPGSKPFQLVVVILLIIGLVFTSTAAYAYWTDVSQVSNIVIEFEGEDANLIVEAAHNEFTGQLVPQGYVYFVGEVDQVIFSYEVSVDKELVQSMNLVVEVIDITIGGLETYQHLVDIKINGSDRYHVNELYNSTVTISIIVTLLEPIDPQEAVERSLEASNVDNAQEAYQAIKGETISFTLRFTVQPRIVS